MTPSNIKIDITRPITSVEISMVKLNPVSILNNGIILLMLIRNNAIEIETHEYLYPVTLIKRRASIEDANCMIIDNEITIIVMDNIILPQLSFIDLA